MRILIALRNAVRTLLVHDQAMLYIGILTMPAQYKAERVALRLAASDKAQLGRAAKLQGRSLSEFMLAASREAAEQVLNEQGRFTLSAEALRKFTAALDAPPRDIPALRRLLACPSVLEK
jgi:uncharacterized protein (DUF1778 family)